MKVKKLHGMGNHLIIDAYNCDSEALNNLKLVTDFLEELVEKMKLTVINPPVVLKHEAEDKEESGVTGFVILAESHVSIHTYPKKRFMSLDVFACSEFNIEEIKEYIKSKFKFDKVKEFLIKREYETC